MPSNNPINNNHHPSFPIINPIYPPQYNPKYFNHPTLNINIPDFRNLGAAVNNNNNNIHNPILYPPYIPITNTVPPNNLNNINAIPV